MNLNHIILALVLTASLQAAPTQPSVTPVTPEKMLQAATISKATQEKVKTLPHAEHVIALTPNQEAQITKLFAQKRTRGALFQKGVKPGDKIKPLEELVTLLAEKTGFKRIKLQHADAKNDIMLEAFHYTAQNLRNHKPVGKITNHVGLKVFFTSEKLAPHWSNLLESLRLRDPFFTLALLKNVGVGVAGTAATVGAYNVVEPIVSNRTRTSRIQKFAEELAAAIPHRTNLFPASSNPTTFVGHAETVDLLGNATVNTEINIAGPGATEIVVVSVLTTAGVNHLLSSNQLKQDTQLKQIKVLVLLKDNFSHLDSFTDEQYTIFDLYGWQIVQVDDIPANSWSQHGLNRLKWITASKKNTAADIAQRIPNLRQPILAELDFTVETTPNTIQEKLREITGATDDQANKNALEVTYRTFRTVTSRDALTTQFTSHVAYFNEQNRQADAQAEERRTRKAAQVAEQLKQANLDLCKGLIPSAINLLATEMTTLLNNGQAVEATSTSCAGAGSGSMTGAIIPNQYLAAQKDATAGYVQDFSMLTPETLSRDQAFIIGAPFPGTIDHLRTSGILSADKKLQHIKVIVIPLTTLRAEGLSTENVAELKKYKWHVIFVNNNQEKFNTMFPQKERSSHFAPQPAKTEWNTFIESNNEWFKGLVWMTYTPSSLSGEKPTNGWHLFTGHNWSPKFRHVIERHARPITDTRDSVFPLLEDHDITSSPEAIAAAVTAVRGRTTKRTRRMNQSLKYRERPSANGRRLRCLTQQQFERDEEALLTQRCRAILEKGTTPQEILGFARDSKPSQEEIDTAYQAKTKPKDDDDSDTPPPRELLLFVETAYRILTNDAEYLRIYKKTKEDIQTEREEEARRRTEHALMLQRQVAENARLETERLAAAKRARENPVHSYNFV